MMTCTFLWCHVSLTTDVSPKRGHKWMCCLRPRWCFIFCTCLFVHSLLSIKVLNEVFSKLIKSKKWILCHLSLICFGWCWCVRSTLILYFHSPYSCLYICCLLSLRYVYFCFLFFWFYLFIWEYVEQARDWKLLVALHSV